MQRSREVQHTTSKHGDRAGTNSSSKLPDPQRIMLVSPTTVRWRQAELSASNSWAHEAGTLHNDAWPLQMVFHSYDPVMAITDDTDNVW